MTCENKADELFAEMLHIGARTCTRSNDGNQVEAQVIQIAGIKVQTHTSTPMRNSSSKPCC